MSKIGKKPIEIPEGVTVEVASDNKVKVKGSKGELESVFNAEIKIEVGDKEILVKPVRDSDELYALWGLTRALLANMIEGVSKGFEKKLEIQGVGYKAALKGNKLDMALGFSHPVEVECPEGLKFEVKKSIITVFGIDKQAVGQTAANIRAFKKPEPYKGKGIRYVGEQVRRKQGKKAAGTAGS